MHGASSTQSRVLESTIAKVAKNDSTRYMHSTVEISHSAIRIVQCNKEHVEEIDEFPVADGTDPINALGAVSLSGSLGSVRVVIHHEDFLLGCMTQSPCPADRLGRLVEFEMKSNLGEQVDNSLIN